MALETYRKLEVWKRSVDLVESIYVLTRRFPPEEKWGLTSQLRRASVSIAANIAEGYGRTHRGDYLHHLSMSKGSLAEVETHLVIAVRLRFVEREEVTQAWDLAQEVGKMLRKLIASLQPPKPQTRHPEP